MKTISYNFDADIGLPIDSLHGGITLVDDAVHVKVWKDSKTGQVTVCIVPMNGVLDCPQILRVTEPAGGVYPATYLHVKPTGIPPAKIRNGKVIHGHDWQHVPVADRSDKNWCSICKDWFQPDYFSRQGI